MAIVSELHIVEEQLSKAKEMLQDSREMVQKMQDIVIMVNLMLMHNFMFIQWDQQLILIKLISF